MRVKKAIASTGRGTKKGIGMDRQMPEKGGNSSRSAEEKGGLNGKYGGSKEKGKEQIELQRKGRPESIEDHWRPAFCCWGGGEKMDPAGESEKTKGGQKGCKHPPPPKGGGFLTNKKSQHKKGERPHKAHWTR